MEQISNEELSADINTIFDRVNRNHETFSVMREKDQAVVILDVGDYRKLTEQNHFGFSEGAFNELEEQRRAYELRNSDSGTDRYLRRIKDKKYVKETG